MIQYKKKFLFTTSIFFQELKYTEEAEEIKEVKEVIEESQ